jgi:Cu/Ag efflux protein CusF/uncharacterized protein YuzE
MLKRKSIIFGAVLAVIMLLAVAGCTPGELQALQGILEKVDSASGNITVKLQDGSTQTFNFTDVSVETIRQTLGNATLEVGDQVMVRIHKNGDIANIDVQNAEVEGVIKSLGTSSVTITTEDMLDVTLQVTTDTGIRIDAKASASFADLALGQTVEAKYNLNTMMAARIHVDTGEEYWDIDGTVKAVDASVKTITIATDKGVDITLLVTPDSTIFIQGEGKSAFSDLAVGQQVEARYDPSTMAALRIMVENHKGNAWGQGHDKGKGND